MSEAVRRFEYGSLSRYAEYLPNHKNMKVSANHTPSDFEHQIIIASICGDGSLSFPYNNRPCNPRISWNMGNREHALYKYNAFNSFIGARYNETDNPGFGDKWYRVVTKSHPLLVNYVEKYGQRKKNLSAKSGIFDELNCVGWAWLYGDDGHLDKSKGLAYIHTESFSYDDVNIIRESLNSFIGFDGSRIHSYIGGVKKREMHCIRMTQGGTNEFMEKIKAHMADGLEYKMC